MIDILLKENNSLYYIRAVGHSGVSGNSIVCVAVSTLFEAWHLSELVLENISISVKEGFIEGYIPKTTISKILFTQLCIGLKSLQSKYSSEISLIIGG